MVVALMTQLPHLRRTVIRDRTKAPAKPAIKSGTTTKESTNAANSFMVDVAGTEIDTTVNTSARSDAEKVRISVSNSYGDI